MKKTENYTIDFATETIIVSKKFLKEAGIFGSPAYNTLKDIRRDNPSFPIVVREIKKKENKKSYRNLTIDNMKTFIQNCMEDGRPLEDRLAEFETVKALSKVQSSPYSYIKTWFLKTYGEEYNKYNNNQDDKAAAEEQKAS